MSVVILGMEMPEHCGECGIEFCVKWINHDATTRPKGCPLRPLPEKHGRLVDVDAVVDKLLSMQVMYQMLDDTRTADKIIHGIIRAKQTIYEAPTIVEAEGDLE